MPSLGVHTARFRRCRRAGVAALHWHGVGRRAGSPRRRGGARAPGPTRRQRKISFGSLRSPSPAFCMLLSRHSPRRASPNPVCAACSRDTVPAPFARCGAAAKPCCMQALSWRNHALANPFLGADLWRAAAPERCHMACDTLQMPLLQRSCDERCGARGYAVCRATP